jgi:hypothetical protein
MLGKGNGDRFENSSQNPRVRKNERATFKGTLRKYLNTHFFHSVDEFFMFNKDL